MSRYPLFRLGLIYFSLFARFHLATCTPFLAEAGFSLDFFSSQASFDFSSNFYDSARSEQRAFERNSWKSFPPILITMRFLRRSHRWKETRYRATIEKGNCKNETLRVDRQEIKSYLDIEVMIILRVFDERYREIIFEEEF